MPRSYEHVKLIEKEIFEMKANGKSNREKSQRDFEFQTVDCCAVEGKLHSKGFAVEI